MDSKRPIRFELLPQDASDSLIDLLTDEQLQRDEISQDLDDAVSRSLSTTLAFSTAQREENRAALKLLAEIGATEDFDQRLRLVERQTFKTSGLCLMLIDESQHLAHNDPARGLDMARLALRSAELLDPSLVGDRVHQDLKAEAWAAVGSAHTALARYEEAEKAFEQAEALLLDGSGTLVPLGLVLAQKARLRIEQRRLEEVGRLVDQALPIYRTASKAADLGHVLVTKGRLLEHQGRGEEAGECYEEALELALCSGSQELQLSAQYRLGGSLLRSGRAEEAETLLEKTQLLAAALGRKLDRAHVRWLQGKAAAALSRPAEAEELLWKAYRGFLSAGFHFEGARVLVELADRMLEQKDATSLLQLAGNLESWLPEAELSPEVARAMADLASRAAQGKLKRAWTGALAEFLATCRIDSRSTFSPP